MRWPKTDRLLERQRAAASPILNPTTAAQRVALYEAALREIEQHRDDLVIACATLQRLLDSERKHAARARGDVLPQQAANQSRPIRLRTQDAVTATEETGPRC